MNPVNDKPSFTAPATVNVNEDSTIYKSAQSWTTAINMGATNESDQTVSGFTVTYKSGATDLFTESGKPAISTSGTLSFTLLSNANGTAVYTVTMKDSGGTANFGVDTSDAFDLTIKVTDVNDAPTFTIGANQNVYEDSGTAGYHEVANWISAASMTTGPANESGQALTGFTVTNNKNGLFAVQPAIDLNGKLTYTLAANANDTTAATVTVKLMDDGGTANSGINYVTKTFTIKVNAVNDQPSYNKVSDDAVVVDEDSTAYSAAWAKDLYMGADNESGQAVSKFTVTFKSGTAGMFSAGPSIDTSGKLSFTPAKDANGTAVYTVTMTDNGGTTPDGSVDTSAAKELTITVNAVNDKPSFTIGADQNVDEDSGTAGYHEVANWISTASMSTGPANEGTQTFSEFVVTNSDSSIFTADGQPAIDVTTGKLTYTLAPNANTGTGFVTVTVKLKDSGGTDKSGADTSDAQTFKITLVPVNDQPSYNKVSDDAVVVDEDSAAYSAAWAKDLYMGADNESGQAVSEFTVTFKSGTDSMFSAGPSIDTSGKLSFTPAKDANGTAVYTVTMTDNGGTTPDGSVDTSAAKELTITVNAVNDAPEFTVAASTTVLEDCGAQTAVNWASGIKTGPDNENTQTLSAFTVTNNYNDLFDAQPSIDASGTLTFTPKANANGDATVTVTISDNGGTEKSGADSTTKTFIIHVTSVNDAPSFTLPHKDASKAADVIVGVGTGTKSYVGWADAMSKGPADESGQTLAFTLTTDNDAIFRTLPTIDPTTGNLSFTPSESANGTAKVTVTLKDSGGTANGGKDSASAEFTIRVLAASELKLTGTIYDAEDVTKVIPGATVNLLNMDGTTKATFTTGADGKYEFDSLAVSHYMIEVQKTGYNDNSRITNVAFDAGVAGVVTEDFYMADFKLVLTADPQKILGDGKSTAKLTATVTDRAGKPIKDVKLSFYAKGTLLSKDVMTNDKGEAEVTYKSDKLIGVDQLLIPIMVTVNDPDRKLYGSDWIYEYFVPGFVEGVVRDGNTNEPIEGATVTVYKDFDGDKVIDFTETQITGKDGKYKIAVPKGNVDYDIKITKPVKIGDKTENVTFDQNVSVGDITGSGTPSETYAPVIAASGVAVLAKEDGSSSIVTDYSAASKMSLQIVDPVTKTTQPLTPDPTTGVFKATGLTAGATYTIDAVYTFDDGKKLVVGTSTITISSTGEMNISQVLIDPYGTITDANTKKAIEGAKVTLFYADTAKNKAAVITPNTQVVLPTVSSFPPSDNANPQDSDASGLYAFMVFPNTDYYIVATKPGYATYTSPTISVGASIVNWNFEMAPLITSGSTGDNDLAIEISSDKMKVEEGTNATLTVLYKNKSAAKTPDYKVTVTVPDGMTVADAAGGAVTGNKIIWSGVDFPAGETKSLKIILTAPTISVKEQSVTVKADITSTNKLINTSDDTSSINLMLFSNRFEGSHKRYIRGYPDSTFGPSRNLTRAETAAIFTRLLDLDTSNTATSYTDVDAASWAAGYISAVSSYGLMKGYTDGSFLPDKAITRAEFATIAARYFQIERSNSVTAIEEHFSDTADSWAKSTIDEVYRYGIINGYSDGTFKPNNSITRAEAVTMVNRMLYRGPVSTDKSLFTDISASDWFYGQVIEASISHSYSINSDSTETVTGWIEDEMK